MHKRGSQKRESSLYVYTVHTAIQRYVETCESTRKLLSLGGNACDNNTRKYERKRPRRRDESGGRETYYLCT